MKRLPSFAALLATVVALVAPLSVAHASPLGRGSNGPAREHSRAGVSALASVRYIYHGLAVQPPHQGKRSGRIKMPLFDQYGVQTVQNQKASIGFHDGTVVQMNQNTDAVLSAHVTRVQNGEIAEYLAPGTDHKVQTATAVASAIGTTYDVRTTGGQSVFVVLHGALQVRNAAGGVVVKNNQQTIVAPNRAPTTPTSADAQAAFAWTSGIPTPDLGEDVALDANGGSVVSYSSQRAGSGDQGHIGHIDDGLLTQGWETADGQVRNQWVKVGFFGGNFYRLSGVIIDPAATYGEPAGEDLKDFEIRVSSSGTDEASFTTVFHGTAQQKDALQHFPFPVPVRAKYVELVALDNYGDPHRIAVAEWEVVATASLLAQPIGLATDRQGNIYVADTNANRVDKLSPRGKMLAHWGRKGRLPGEFLRPGGVAVDKHGTIYVADTYNHRIQKLSPQGRFLAQWGSSGIKAGEFLFPHDVAVDSVGNVYVVDIVNRVQKFSSNGKLLAVWSDFGSAGSLNFPEGVTVVPGHQTVDGTTVADTIVVADTDNNRIVKLSTSGEPLATFGAQGSSPGQFNQPIGIASDRTGNIYVADSFNYRLQRIDPAGKVTIWGKFGSGPGRFVLPQGVTTDAHGNVFVADTGSSRIEKFAPSGKVQAVWGKYATVPQVLGEPVGIAADTRGSIYVTDDLNDRVQQRTLDGNVQAVYGYHGYVALQRGRGLGQFWYPHGIAVDRTGRIYVADTFNSRIQVLANRGPIAVLGKHGTAPGQFNVPMGVAVDTRGTVYVADTGNNRIQKLSPSGKVLAVFGSKGKESGQFSLPMGIAVDHEGDVYVADSYNDRIQKLSPAGTVLDVWGQAGYALSDRFSQPEELAIDRQDNVYVADGNHGVVQKLSPSGRVLAIFQLPGPNAHASGVTVDARGNVYATDALESRIVKFAPTGEVLAIWE